MQKHFTLLKTLKSLMSALIQLPNVDKNFSMICGYNYLEKVPVKICD